MKERHDRIMSLFTGSCGALVCLENVVASGYYSRAATHRFVAEEDITYYIFVSGPSFAAVSAYQFDIDGIFKNGSPITAAPSTQPSVVATTFAPTAVPSVQPSVMATTSSPTASPITAHPSAHPSAMATTSSPTASPITAHPSDHPSAMATTSSPTASPIAADPSAHPSAMATTSSPTASPVTAVPSVQPSATVPRGTIFFTGSPSSQPSVRVGTSLSTAIPISAAPSSGPTAKVLVASPTGVPLPLAQPTPQMSPATMAPSSPDFRGSSTNIFVTGDGNGAGAAIEIFTKAPSTGWEGAFSSSGKTHQLCKLIVYVALAACLDGMLW
jgi:hypothetical protein